MVPQFTDVETENSFCIIQFLSPLSHLVFVEGGMSHWLSWLPRGPQQSAYLHYYNAGVTGTCCHAFPFYMSAADDTWVLRVVWQVLY